ARQDRAAVARVGHLNVAAGAHGGGLSLRVVRVRGRHDREEREGGRYQGSGSGAHQNSASAEPPSVRALPVARLPARSAGSADEFQIIVVVLVTVFAVVLGVPKVIVTTAADCTIEDAVPVAPNVIVA